MKRKISKYNQRIIIQKGSACVDRRLNHTTVWEDFFPCWTYANTYKYDEEEEGAGTKRREETITFEVRYCSILAGVNSKEHRVIFHGDVYNIISVDMMNYQNGEISIKCKYEKRYSA